MTYSYSLPWVVYDRSTGTLAGNRVDGQLVDIVTGDVIPTYDKNGLQVPLRTGSAGVLEVFYADATSGLARFGETTTVIISDWALDAKNEAIAAAADAAATRAAVERLADNASEIAYFYLDTDGGLWLSETPVLVGGGVPRIDEDGDPVVVFTATI